jgi:SIR2-like protein/TIR domain-containing protein
MAERSEPPAFHGLVPVELTDAIRLGRCIAFVGAGLSARVRRSSGLALPLWSPFLIELLDWAIARQVRFWGDPEDIRAMIRAGDLLAAAQEIQERVGTTGLGEFLNTIFRDSAITPSVAHRLLPRIAFRAVLTTNYDALIEGAYAIADRGRIPPVLTQEDLLYRQSPLRNSDFFIFKVHGHLDRPGSVVLGSRDYQELMFRTPGYRQFLETLFATHAVLFLGFGGSDPDLENVLDRLAAIYSRTLDRHFILVPAGKFNTTAKRRLALDRRLEVIDYLPDSSHSQVVAFLRELRRQASRSATEVSRLARTSAGLKIFISYSMQDAEAVTRLSGVLRDQGYVSWMAGADLLPGDELRQRISEALSSADVVMIVFSPHSIESPWVRYETDFAIVREIEKRTVVMPVVIGDVMPPVFLRDRLFLRLRPDFAAGDLAPILRALKRIESERRQRERGSTDPEQPEA